MRIVLMLIPLLTLVSVSTAVPIAPGAIEVIDGDTVRTHGRTVRLVGFDAPESGLRAQCETERTLAARGNWSTPVGWI
jgi:endonuclease YncB( thermonuclease family)